MSGSPDDLFARYLDPYLQRIEEMNSSQEVNRQTVLRQNAFQTIWNAVYADFGQDRINMIVGQLMALVDGIEERFWDFEIARLLRHENDPEFSISHNIAVAVLIYACRRQFDRIAERIGVALDTPNDINFWHCRVYEHLSGMVRIPTPPATETELAEVLQTTRTAINNQVRSRRPKWQTIGPRGEKRWCHVDGNRQAEVLRAFRDFFPSKPWLDVRPQWPPNE